MKRLKLVPLENGSRAVLAGLFGPELVPLEPYQEPPHKGQQLNADTWPAYSIKTSGFRPVLRLAHYELLLDTREEIEVPQHWHHLWEELRLVANGWVKLVYRDGRYFAMATPLGYTSARHWFKLKPYKHRMQTKNLNKLMRNFNKFVAEETDWEPFRSVKCFRECCMQNADMRERWAPNHDFNSYR